MNQRQTQKISLYSAVSRIVLGVATLVILLILLDISSKTVLRRDDYWEIYGARQQGLFKFLLFFFKTNSGRFTAAAMKAFSGYGNPLYWIRASIFVFAICFFLTIEKFSRRFFSERDQSWALSLLIFGGVYQVQTKIWESFFWGAGNNVYGWGILAAVAAWVSFYGAQTNKSRISLFFALILGFLSSGFAQGINLSMLTLSGIRLLFAFRSRTSDSDSLKTAASFFAVILISTIIAFAIPGNYVNASTYLPQHQEKIPTASKLLMTLQSSFLGLTGHVRTQIPLFLFFFSAFVLFGTTLRSDPIPEIFRPRVAQIIATTLIISAYVSLLLNGFLGYLPSRVYSIPLTQIFFAVMVLGLAIGAMLGKRFKIRAAAPFVTPIILLVLTGLWLNFYQSHRVQLYRIHRTWTERDRTLRELALNPQVAELESVETCAVELNGTPLLDIPAGTTDWVIGQYYNLPPLSAEEPCH